MHLTEGHASVRLAEVFTARGGKRLHHSSLRVFDVFYAILCWPLARNRTNHLLDHGLGTFNWLADEKGLRGTHSGLPYRHGEVSTEGTGIYGLTITVEKTGPDTTTELRTVTGKPGVSKVMGSATLTCSVETLGHIIMKSFGTTAFATPEEHIVYLKGRDLVDYLVFC